MKANVIINCSISISVLLTKLFFIWLTLGWKTRKARKAFEEELIKQGMSKMDAERIGARYVALKNVVMRAFWGSIGRMRFKETRRKFSLRFG